MLVIENNPSDVKRAVRILKSLEIDQPIVLTSVAKALMHLEDVVAGEKPCPEMILLDLEFGAESGFEVLRFQKMNPRLQQCQVLVWTVMGEREKELCRLFGITQIVSKQDGDAALEAALKSMIESQTTTPANPAKKPDNRRAGSSST